MDLFSFVKNNVDIIPTISEYTSLKKTGSQYWKGLCPFHHEKTPSFTVSPHKKIFYCFGCHETGDVINFIEKTENISAIQAVQHLIQRYNLDIPESLESSHGFKKEKNDHQLCKLVTQWCVKKLQSNNIVKNYIKRRNIDSIQVSQFELGYFPAGSKAIQELLSYVMHHNFSSKDLVEQNILFQGKTLYSPFEDRIIFPISDHLGQSCGFGGRIFKEHDQRPKYYNSKETAQFKKGKILFGLHIAKQEIQRKKAAFIVEGYTDCIAMHQHGYRNTVATLGTACSSDHLKQLSQHAQTLYILYDADSAGKQAILRMTQLCWQFEMELKVISLPADQDPASVLETEKSIDHYVEKSVDIFSFFLQSSGQQFHKSSMKNKLLAINELLDLIANIKDPLKQNILLVKASEIMQIPLEILKKEYNNKEKIAEKSSKIEPKPTLNSEKILEEQILAAILHDSTLLTPQYETLLLAKLSETISSIIKKIINCQKKTSESCSKNLEILLTPQELTYTQSILFKIESSNLQQTFNNLMVQFQKKHWKSIISHIKVKLIQAKQENDSKKVQELLDAFESVKKDLYKNGRL